MTTPNLEELNSEDVRKIAVTISNNPERMISQLKEGNPKIYLDFLKEKEAIKSHIKEGTIRVASNYPLDQVAVENVVWRLYNNAWEKENPKPPRLDELTSKYGKSRALKIRSLEEHLNDDQDWGLDELMIPIIEELNQNGYTTLYQSCQGHGPTDHAFLMIDADSITSQKDISKIRKIIKNHTQVPFKVKKLPQYPGFTEQPRYFYDFEGPLKED